MALLLDHDAQRISDEVERCSDRAVLARWIAALLADRKDRSALIISLSRQLHHARGRLSQAVGYLDGLLSSALEAAGEPWPNVPEVPAAGTGAVALTDGQVEEIRRGLNKGMRGPVLIKWCEQLLADRDERVAEAKRKARGVGALESEPPDTSGARGRAKCSATRFS